LEVLEAVIDEVRHLFDRLRSDVLHENHLDLESELDSLSAFLFSETQRLYHKKELAILEKESSHYYSAALERITKASQSPEERQGEKHIQWFMNKPKLIALYKELDPRQTESLFTIFTVSVQRSNKISLLTQKITNLQELGSNFVKNFKLNFADKLLDLLS